MRDDIVKGWVDYWTRHKPNGPYFDRVLYGLYAERDYSWGEYRKRLNNVIWHALQAYDKFSKEG